MTGIIATNIVSPLGTTTEQNLQAVKAGKSALATFHSGIMGIPGPLTAAVFSKEQAAAIKLPGFSFFESLVIASARDAIERSGIDVASPRVVFILSTTKANVSNLAPGAPEPYTGPALAAGKIARHLGFSTRPLVVCNACISGVSAQILADALFRAGSYDYAVVCGADCVSAFIMAGFLSFKALSPDPCRPFDIERTGLNSGEAAATMVLGKDKGTWHIAGAAQTSDAYNLSAPLPGADGLKQALEAALGPFDRSKLSCINVHGTATMFNDQMESKAIEGEGLSQIPVSALKGYYGHTMGAAGLLEPVLILSALEEGFIPAVMGYQEIGVSGKMNLSSAQRECPDATSLLKLISGFGSCNAAILYTKDACPPAPAKAPEWVPQVLRSVRITPVELCIDGKVQALADGSDVPTVIYRQFFADYPRFFKMDIMAKLAFVGSSLLLQHIPQEEKKSIPLLFACESSSVVSDKKHIASYSSPDGFFPSPSVFLYTLPNVALGEVSIRHGITAPCSLYILPRKDMALLRGLSAALYPQGTKVAVGWVDCPKEDSFDVEIELITI